MKFNERTTKRLKSLWDSQTGRASEKKSKKTGRILRHGYQLQFSKQQFIDWLLLQFGGSDNGVSRCRYCNRPVDLLNCELDHIIPLKRRGLPSLDNMAITCDACNPIKGQMTGSEFAQFLDCMVTMNRVFPDGMAVRDIMHRLQSYSGMKATVNANRARQAKQKAVAALATPAVEGDF